MSIFHSAAASIKTAGGSIHKVGRMDCAFHVEGSVVADWAEWRVDGPTRGDRIVHEGHCYDVVSSVWWQAESLTCFVAVTPQVPDPG
jgi:hypothetical protein